MHDQSASPISGRTRAAVSAMCVRTLRMTVLKSAGNFTRDERHDLSAEKIQRVKCFMFTSCGIFACQQFSNAGAAGWVRKFQAVVNWRKWRLTSPCPVYPRKQTSNGRVGMSAGLPTGDSSTSRGMISSRRPAAPQSALLCANAVPQAIDGLSVIVVRAMSGRPHSGNALPLHLRDRHQHTFV